MPWDREILRNSSVNWFNNTVYREHARVIFDKLVEFVLNDPTLYMRLRQILEGRNLKEEVNVEPGHTVSTIRNVVRQKNEQSS